MFKRSVGLEWRQVVGWALAFVPGLGVVWIPAAHAGGCAKAEIVSGKNCQDLVVRFNLDACGDSEGGAHPVLRCNGGSAKVTLKTDKGSYVAKLKKGDGAWGESSWKVVGDVQSKGEGEGHAKHASASHESKHDQGHEAAHGESKSAAAEHAGRDGKTEAAHGSAEHAAEAKHAEAQHAEADAPHAPVAAPAPAAPAAGTPPALVFNGLLDLYYAYNFNRPMPSLAPATSATGTQTQNRSLPANQNVLHNFDLYHNQLALNLAELSFKHTGKQVSLKVDLDFGETADWTHTAGNFTDEVSKHIGQAIVAYNPSGLSNLTLSAGKMATHLGYEVIKTKDNWQYSRSFLFALALPYWHTGVSAAYAWVPGKFSTTAYLYNGWNNLTDNNTAKSVGGQIAFTPSDSLAIFYNVITGPEQDNNTSNYKTVHEANFVLTATPWLSIAGDSVYGMSNNETVAGATLEHPTWIAGSLATKFTLASWYSISPRVEIYRDNGGYTTGTGISQTLDSQTLTQAFTLAEGFELRAEARRDHSTETPFADHQGAPKNSQYTGTLGILYSF